MKLFKRLLIAPAALGLMAPIATNADTAFTSTTTLGGSAYFTTGSVDAGTGEANEELYSQYRVNLSSNSSFTGEDNLKVGLKVGNASGPLASMDNATGAGSDAGGALSMSTLFYSFPVSDLSVTVGPLLAQDDVLAATTSAYSDEFRLGSMPFSAAGSEKGPGVAISYAIDNGVVASASFVAADGADSTKGINTDSGNDVTTVTLGYDGDGFGGGLIVASNDGDVGTDGYDTFGGGIYYSPESFPATFSVAYDTKDPETGADATDLFIGVDYEVGPGTLSAAWNSTDVDDNSDNTDITGYEVSYSYSINDGVTVTPGIFTVDDGEGEEDTGVVVETAFSF